MPVPQPPTMIECPACRKDFTPPAAASIPYGCAHCRSQVVGAYCDLELIGDGGMGKVYRARRPDMRDQRVAIKIPKTSDVQSRERFNREIAASATLRHENIVRAFDCGEADGQLFLVMQLEEGQILNDLVRSERQLSCRTVGNIVRDIAKGLVHANAYSIVNRDIKPENILVSTEGLAKLLDFGLAIIAGTDGSADRTTTPGTLLGTAAFMAPEQARDPRDVTIAADVYSLGCTAYYALAGHPPFDGGRDQIFQQHATAPRPEIIGSRSDVPPILSALIARMMAITPAERPSAESIVAELSSYLPHLPTETSGQRETEVFKDGAIEEGLIEEGQPLDDHSGPAPQLGELLDEHARGLDTAIEFDTSSRPILPLPDPLSHTGADDGIATLPESDRIEEGEPVEDLPLGSLIGHDPLAAGEAGKPALSAAPAGRPGRRSSPHSKQRRNLIVVMIAAILFMGGTWSATRYFNAPPDPQAIWDGIQEEYQLHKWKLVETQLAEFAADYPDDPHVAEIPFFLAMCDAGRDIFSQTGDVELGLQKIDQVFLDFRDTQEYDKYCSDLFLDLQRIIERLVERTEKTAQPEALASAQKAHELLSTVAQSMPEQWVEAKVSDLGGSIRRTERQLEVALAKEKLVDMLAVVSASASTDESLDRTYDDAKALLQQHAQLQGDADIAAAFSSAYASEATRVTYEPFSEDADETLAEAVSPPEETIFVVWDQPSAAGSANRGEVFLSLADGVLYAFDGAGTHLWSHRVGFDSHRLPVSLKPSSTSPEAVIAVSTVDNSLLALASRTGRVLWRFDPGADQDLASSLTISRWRPAPNKPERVRGLIPTAGGEIHVLELVRGKRMGRFQTNLPMTVGGSFDPVTQLVFFPADSKRVLAIDPAVIEDQNATSSAVRSVLFTNHLSGSLRSKPLIVGQYMLLTELLDLENTQVRAFELQNPMGFARPDAAPVKDRILHGWSWFTPPLTPDRMTVVTDAGELGVFGLNLDNPDEALYPLIHDGKGQCPTLGVDAPYRAMAIHSDEHLLWVMAGGTLRQIGLDILAQKVTTLWPEDESAAEVVGMPLHEATFDRESERLYLTTRSLDATRAEFAAVDANTGTKLWARQLGVHVVGDPIVSNDGAMLVDRTGRILQLSASESEDGTSRVNVIADDRPPAEEAAGELLRLRDLEGQEYLALPVASGRAIAIRAIDPSLPFQPPWQTVTLPSTRLQGRPAVLEGYLMVPCSNGSLQRIPFAGSAVKRRNEQTFQWAPESTVASDDSPAVYPMGSGQVLVVLRQSLRWLDYATSEGVGYWKERKQVLVDGPVQGELAMAGDYLFMAGPGRALYRVRRDGTGDPDTWQLEGRPTAGPFAIQSGIFVVLDGRKLVRFNPSSETASWTLGPGKGHIRGRPVVVGRSLLVTEDSGKIMGVSLNTGQVVGEVQLPPGAIPIAAAIPFGRRRFLAPLADGTLAWQPADSPRTSSRQPGVSR